MTGINRCAYSPPAYNAQLPRVVTAAAPSAVKRDITSASRRGASPASPVPNAVHVSTVFLVFPPSQFLRSATDGAGVNGSLGDPRVFRLVPTWYSASGRHNSGDAMAAAYAVSASGGLFVNGWKCWAFVTS